MRIAKSILVLVIGMLAPLSRASGDPTASGVKDGDIIFHSSRSSQSLAIQRATGSRYSHMGIIFIVNGAPMVFEAVQTVRYTPLGKWTARGEGGHFVVKRLADGDRLLTPETLRRLREQAAKFKGKPYDLTFEWSDDRIYCSELVWKIYERALGIRIGSLQHLRDFRLDEPMVRKKMNERYGSKIPLNEPVIAPSAMFNAPNLLTVLEQ